MSGEMSSSLSTVSSPLFHPISSHPFQLSEPISQSANQPVSQSQGKGRQGKETRGRRHQNETGCEADQAAIMVLLCVALCVSNTLVYVVPIGVRSDLDRDTAGNSVESIPSPSISIIALCCDQANRHHHTRGHFIARDREGERERSSKRDYRTKAAAVRLVLLISIIPFPFL